MKTFAVLLVVVFFASFVCLAPEAWAAPVTHTGTVERTRAEGTKFLFRVDGHWYETTSEWIEREIRDARAGGRPVTVNGNGSGTNSVTNPSAATNAES